MKQLRSVLSVVVLVALAAGYLASQYAFFAGFAPDYAQKVDTPAVKMLALVLLLTSIALAFIPERNEVDP